MAVNRVEIKNLTVFEDTAIDFCEGVNVLIGENGTGKTHLMKFIYGTLMCSYNYELLQRDKTNGTQIFDANKLFNTTARSLMRAENIYNSIVKVKTDSSTHYNYEIDSLSSCKVFYNEGHFRFDWSFVSDPNGYGAGGAGGGAGGLDDTRAYGILPAFMLPPNAEPKGDYILLVVPYNTKFENNAVFIPAKDMVTHSNGFPSIARRRKREMPFDDTLLDIIDTALQSNLDNIPSIALNVIPILERSIGGKVIVENNDFYVQKNCGNKIKFSAEAEGIKKIGLLWRLLMNESITKDTILFWDEPEANINPKLIPVIVEILLELSRQGVQIFAATHDYVFSKYFEVRRKNGDLVMFHSLYEENNDGVKCESNVNFRDLNNNPINDSFDELMDEVIFHNVGD
ncbi:MAG: AAA family ATPase [Oscillospiraceae bacterium]|nr:AAA family ATPase [Oscillospiraceae bacterium]